MALTLSVSLHRCRFAVASSVVHYSVKIHDFTNLAQCGILLAQQSPCFFFIYSFILSLHARRDFRSENRLGYSASRPTELALVSTTWRPPIFPALTDRKTWVGGLWGASYPNEAAGEEADSLVGGWITLGSTGVSLMIWATAKNALAEMQADGRPTQSKTPRDPR